MKPIFAILTAFSLTLAAASPIFADDNLDSPDTLQKTRGPGGLDATAPVLNKKAAVVATPSPLPVPKAPEKKKSSY
jgi:hypothetical protein